MFLDETDPPSLDGDEGQGRRGVGHLRRRRRGGECDLQRHRRARAGLSGHLDKLLKDLPKVA